MNNLTLILTLSAIIWYCIDRIKPIWTTKAYGKYITTAVAGLLSTAAVYGYNLDLIYSMGIVVETTMIGKILTILSLMCGSSAISEIIARIKID